MRPGRATVGDRAFYNDTDPYAAQWTRNLMAAGHITEGVVDERSIVELAATDLVGFDRVHAFSGIAGWDYALELAGWSGPIWTGSCPCQPWSSAGQRGRDRGFADARHLWPAWFELIRECRPDTVLGEQVSGAGGRSWLDAVQADLERVGYRVGVLDLPAASVGAPHVRARLYFAALRLGDSDQVSAGRDTRDARRAEAASSGARQVHRVDRDIAVAPGRDADLEWLELTDGTSRPTRPGLRPVAPRLPGDVARIGAFGNAIHVELAATFIRCVMGELGMQPIARAA